VIASDRRGMTGNVPGVLRGLWPRGRRRAVGVPGEGMLGDVACDTNIGWRELERGRTFFIGGQRRARVW
jgi:hypothetical protein